MAWPQALGMACTYVCMYAYSCVCIMYACGHCTGPLWTIGCVSAAVLHGEGYKRPGTAKEHNRTTNNYNQPQKTVNRRNSQNSAAVYWKPCHRFPVGCLG